MVLQQLSWLKVSHFIPWWNYMVILVKDVMVKFRKGCVCLVGRSEVFIFINFYLCVFVENLHLEKVYIVDLDFMTFFFFFLDGCFA